jgi:hypothetical protein
MGEIIPLAGLSALRPMRGDVHGPVRDGPVNAGGEATFSTGSMAQSAIAFLRPRTLREMDVPPMRDGLFIEFTKEKEPKRKFTTTTL